MVYFVKVMGTMFMLYETYSPNLKSKQLIIFSNFIFSKLLFNTLIKRNCNYMRGLYELNPIFYFTLFSLYILKNYLFDYFELNLIKQVDSAKADIFQINLVLNFLLFYYLSLILHNVRSFVKISGLE